MYSEITTLSSMSPTIFANDKELRHSVFEFTSTLSATVSAGSTTTAAITGCSDQQRQQQIIENKTLNTYVESMTDKELETILEQLNLLPDDTNTEVKCK